MKVFSFCLQGPQKPKQYTGLLENLRLISTHFSDWNVFVQLGADVPAHYIQKLLQFPQVALRQTVKTGPILMMYRFLALDEENVEIMLVRDADSRIHVRDRQTIREFIHSHHKAHTIRDHPWHTTEIMGGLWGLKRGLLESVGHQVTPYLENPWAHGKDQEFLRDVLYPLLKHDLLVHTSQSMRYSTEEDQQPIPMAWSEAQQCGRVENIPALFNIFRR